MIKLKINMDANTRSAQVPWLMLAGKAASVSVDACTSQHGDDL